MGKFGFSATGFRSGEKFASGPAVHVVLSDKPQPRVRLD